MPRAELYNRLIIERTGIVGVHCSAPDAEFLCCTVCTDVLSPVFQARFAEGLRQLAPGYRH
jgi:hypothetical protein